MTSRAKARVRVRDETLERESRGGRERRGLFVGVRERECGLFVCCFVLLIDE